MSTGKVLLGVLAGVAAGALLGILFAPDKGTVTRKKISKKGEDLKDDVKETFNEFIDNMTEKYEKVRMIFQILRKKRSQQRRKWRKKLKLHGREIGFFRFLVRV